MDNKLLLQLNEEFKNKSAHEIINYALEKYSSEKIALATSFSIEDQLLTYIMAEISDQSRIFFIDTGRHFQNTYDLMHITSARYNIKFEIYAPDNKQLEEMLSEYGPNLFYDSVDLRKKCCEIRKVIPLKRVLKTVNAWICGLRREQSPTRDELKIFEWDKTNNIVKINPLAYWSESEVWEFTKNENIPFNNLYKEKFRSIGCQPCTRSIGPGQSIRAGRWWWENPDNKECGLHI